jgi:hypothetical protein
MPETTIISSSPDGELFKGKTSEELDKLLNEFSATGSMTIEDAPVEAPPAEVPAGEAPVEPVEPEPPAAPEPEVDLAASEKEGDRFAREKLEAQLSLLMAHNSRLAGKLGFLEQKLNSAPAASEPFEPQTQQEVDRLTVLERRLAESESKRNQAEVSQAIAESIGKLDGAWVQDLATEIAVVAPKYADQIKAAQESNDPELARQIATAVATVVKAEATQMKWAARHESMVAQKTAATADMAKAKKAQTPSGSGGVPPPPPKQKEPGSMTADEADKWLRENVP